MSTKTHYELLGLSRGATLDDIQQAYLLKSKEHDPAQFDRESNPRQRARANEMLRDVTAAYAVLKDAGLRAEYDRLLADVAVDDNCPRPSATPPVGIAPPQNTTSLPASMAQPGPRLVAGHCKFSSLPHPIQESVIARQADTMKPQVRVPLDWSIWNYLGLLACGGILAGSLFLQAIPLNWLVLRPTIGRPWWDWKAHVALFYWGLVAAAIGYGALNIYRIVRTASHRLKSNLIVTPLYLIRTRGDEVWYWPIFDLKEIRLDSRLHSPISGLGYVTLVLSTGEVGVGLLPPRKHQQLAEFAQAAKTEALNARKRDAVFPAAGENEWAK